MLASTGASTHDEALFDGYCLLQCRWLGDSSVTRGIDLFELPPRSPELNGGGERNNGAWRYEFYATWDLPHHDQRSRQPRPRRISSRSDGRRDACRPPPHLICREAVQTVDSGERLRKSSDDDGRHCFRGGREAAPRGVCAPVDVVVRGAVPRSGAAACLAAPGRARRRSFRFGAFRPGAFRPGSFPFRTFRRPGRRSLPAGGHALERHPRGVLRAGRCGRAAARLARRCRRRRRKPGRNAADKSASARLTAPGVRGRSPGRMSAHASA